mmetsp:Transcript_20142/g.47042  ORF Transcript_20142/g.47042 Transcript_20142/m.47042 type:complete len:243 (-) Transcript_20142:7462-8190(-)
MIDHRFPSRNTVGLLSRASPNRRSLGRVGASQVAPPSSERESMISEDWPSSKLHTAIHTPMWSPATVGRCLMSRSPFTSLAGSVQVTPSKERDVISALRLPVESRTHTASSCGWFWVSKPTPTVTCASSPMSEFMVGCSRVWGCHVAPWSSETATKMSKSLVDDVEASNTVNSLLANGVTVGLYANPVPLRGSWIQCSALSVTSRRPSGNNSNCSNLMPARLSVVNVLRVTMSLAGRMLAKT